MQKTFWRFVLFVVVPAALFYLLILGRALPALFVLFIVLPMIVKEIKSLRKEERGDSEQIEGDAYQKAANDRTHEKLTRDEALDILGIEEDASEDDIQKAYTKLIKKNHPDQDGNEWLASRINAARDALLEKKLFSLPVRNKNCS